MGMPNYQTSQDQLEYAVQEDDGGLELKDLLSADHDVRPQEVWEKFEALSSRVSAEIVDAEMHGYHGSELERSILRYLESLELKVSLGKTVLRCPTRMPSHGDR